MFNITEMKIAELAQLVNIKPPVLSKKFRDLSEPRVVRSNNRIAGLSPELVEDYFLERGHENLFKTTLILSNSTVGGTGKTSSVLALAAAVRRMTDRKKPVIVIDTDSQASSTHTLLGHPIADDAPVLNDYLDGRCGLADILTPVGDPDQNFWVIGSNLNNIYLDKTFSKPKDIREGMLGLFQDLLSNMPEGTRIIIDTPPQLSGVTTSCICGFSELYRQNNYQVHYVIPVRPDTYSLKGAQISMKEKNDTLSTFGLVDFPTTCFLTAYDKRLKVGVEIMRQLLQDELLQDHVSPVLIRYSSEISKASLDHKNIFTDGKQTPATRDYTDLLMSILGYETEIKGQA